MRSKPLRIALALSLALSLYATGVSAGDKLYLVVAASREEPADIVAEAKRLESAGVHGKIVSTTGCGEKKNIYAYVAFGGDRLHAEKIRGDIETKVRDAYLKACSVAPGSLLSFDFPTIDPTILNVPADAVNWSDEDRVSSTIPIRGGSTLIVVRRYRHAPNDPLEGRRQSLYLADKGAAPKKLIDNCMDPGNVSRRDDLVMFDCVSGEAAHNAIHDTVVVDLNSVERARVSMCRKPEVEKSRQLSCLEETIDASGKLTLRAKSIPLAVP